METEAPIVGTTVQQPRANPLHLDPRISSSPADGSPTWKTDSESGTLSQAGQTAGSLEDTGRCRSCLEQLTFSDKSQHRFSLGTASETAE